MERSALQNALRNALPQEDNPDAAVMRRQQMAQGHQRMAVTVGKAVAANQVHESHQNVPPLTNFVSVKVRRRAPWLPRCASCCRCPTMAKIRKCCNSCLKAVSMLTILLLATLGVGMSIESQHAIANGQPTALFGATTTACVRSDAGVLVTQPITSETLGESVQHCGACGSCSSDSDISITRASADNLTHIVTQCALAAVFGGEQGISDCFDEHVGLTSSCTACWTANVLCDLRSCFFTCAWDVLRRRHAYDALSSCAQCDEKLCRPGFVACAGFGGQRIDNITGSRELASGEYASAAPELASGVEQRWCNMLSTARRFYV